MKILAQNLSNYFNQPHTEIFSKLLKWPELLFLYSFVTVSICFVSGWNPTLTKNPESLDLMTHTSLLTGTKTSKVNWFKYLRSKLATPNMSFSWTQNWKTFAKQRSVAGAWQCWALAFVRRNSTSSWSTSKQKTFCSDVQQRPTLLELTFSFFRKIRFCFWKSPRIQL